VSAPAVKFTVHPLAELIPPMSSREYADLKADLEANGQQEPITLYEGKILDGRHRARALDELNLRPISRTYEGDEPAAYVISLNLTRRDLTMSQRAAVAVEFLPALEEEGRKRQGHGLTAPGQPAPERLCSGEHKRSREIAAEICGVAHAQIGRAKRVKRDAPDDFERIRRGEISIGAAHSKLTKPTTNPPPSIQPINSKRALQMANSARLRMERAVGMAAGISSGYPHLRPDRALAVATPEEVDGWLSTFSEATKAIRNLKQQVEAIR